MPSKLKKAISAMKDQTSISLAKVGGADSSSLEVAILKATTHDEVPVEERYVTEILRIVSSNRSYAGSCARAIGRRIGRTRNWIVAVKSLIIILRVFQDGDPHFPKEVMHAMKRGYKILNLNSFRDDSSTSCPWDFTAFVRTFALYLDERLECFVTGKLQRRKSYHQSDRSKAYSRKNEPIVRDMKPSVLLDRILHWQKLLDRAIATQPTGAARTNQVVQTCLYAIVQETFDLYRDISDGLALLLDSFFHLQYKNCVSAFQTCVKASKQFGELASFFELCKSIGVGRTSEYPSVQKVSEELIETLQEFLKDQSSFPATNGRRTTNGSANLPPLSPNSESSSVRRSEYSGSHGMSLEDLIGGDDGYSPERYSDPGREKPSQLEEYNSTNDTVSVKSDPADHRGINSMLDLLSLDDPSSTPEFQGQSQHVESNIEGLSSPSGWELVLFETNVDQPSIESSNHVNHDSVVASNNNGFELDLFKDFNNAPSTSSFSPLHNEQSYYNPFLQDTIGLSGQFGHGSTNASFSNDGFPTDLSFSVGSTFPTTFNAEFDNTGGNNMDHFSTGFPTELSINRTRSVPLSFNAEFGNNISNNINNFEVDLFDDIGRSSNFSSNTNISVLPNVGFCEHNRSISTSFLDDFNHANVNVSTAHHARFASSDLSASLAFSDGSSNNACASEFTNHHARSGSNLSMTSSAFSNDFDSTRGYTSDGIVPPTFSGDGNANAMNAIVPFGQVGNDDLFSSGPKFQATPTFRATSLDMDQHQQSSLWNDNDPFESFPTTWNANDHQKMSGVLDQKNLLQQQQLWLQNQNKIIARHLT